jgi:hypothetical protein
LKNVLHILAKDVGTIHGPPEEEEILGSPRELRVPWPS